MKKNIVKEQSLIIVGTFLYALGTNIFLAPNKISGGGVSAIATVFLHLLNFHLSVTNFVVNVALYIIGYRMLGKYVVLKNLTGTLYVSFFLELTRKIIIYSEDLMIATVAGGILVGIGVGLTLRAEGSTGGTDFAGLIVKKILPHIPIAYTILFFDLVGVVGAGIVFRSFTVAFYSGIALYIGAKLTDFIISFGDSAKSISIFSDKTDEIYSFIKKKFERDASGIYCKGMYSNKEKIMLYCIVSPKELPQIISHIKEIDKRAFVVINSAREVIGEGFKQMD